MNQETRPAHSPYGILAAVDGGEPGTYRVVAVDPRDGSAVWQSQPFSAPSAPEVAWATQDGRPWAIAYTVDDGVLHLRSFDGLAGTARTTPTAESTFTLAKKASVFAVFAGDGVLVSNTAKGSVWFRPATGQTVTYEGTAKRDGRLGLPVAVVADGWVISYPDGGFALATTAGGGWESSTVTPDGGDVDGGRVLALGGGYLLAEWGDHLVALHDVRTGKVVATARTGLTEPLPGLSGGLSLVVSEDGYWAAWGDVVFDLRTATGTQVEIADDVAAAIWQDVLYTTDAPGAEKSSAPEHVIDLVVHEPVGVAPTLTPVAFTAAGLGVFQAESGDALTIAAYRLR